MSKGAFTYGAGKRMSGSKTGLTGSGKMSSAHGTTGQSKDNNMNRNTGGYRIGSDCPTFKHEGYKTAGYSGGATKHASQPSGHKKNA